MDGFAWAEGNLPVRTPQELQGDGVNVLFAPNISPNTKLVNLSNGRIEQFFDYEKRPGQGCFASFADLARYCHRHGLPLVETDGLATVQSTTGEAGDPLQHPRAA